MATLLLDGNKIDSSIFDEEFKKIVGCSEKEWIEKHTTESDGGGEWYEFKDKNFTLGGTAYSSPKLYRNN